MEHRKGPSLRRAFRYIGNYATAFSVFRQGATGEPRSASLKARGFVEATAGGSRANVPWIDLMTMPEVAGTHPELSTLVSIYDVTEFSFKLEQSRHVTTLMPTNEAFERRNLPRILPCLDYDSVQQLLQSMIFEEPFKASELPDGRYSLTATSGLHVTALVARAPDEVAEEWRSGDDRSHSQRSTLTTHSPATAHDANGLLTGNQVRPEGSSRSVVTPTVTFTAANCTAGNTDGFLDTANGIAYVVDAVLVPPALEAVLAAAAHKCAAIAESATLLRPAAVPRHIELTNQHHWFWGRLTGTPAEDAKLSEAFRSSPESIPAASPKPLQTVGVLQRKPAVPNASGVLGRR